MRVAMFLLGLVACTREGDDSAPDSDSDSDSDVIDSDSDVDTGISLQLGDACDAEADVCGGGTICCTACCAAEATPICTEPDVSGTCPLPNITVDTGRLVGSLDVQDVYFAEGDCAIAEGCVNAPGWRRVIRFGTTTPNRGTADLFFGDPAGSDLFEVSECHGHTHFTSYADYRLLDADGNAAALGRKQAFCLMDYEPDPNAATPGAGIYTCDYQGISRGWQDTYSSYLDCQWIDVTDVPAGTYQLEVDLNAEQVLAELDYGDNLAQVPFVLVDPADEPPVTVPCETESYSVYRNCGWEIDDTYRCAPGADVNLDCVQAEGDPMYRVCEGSGAECAGRDAIANIDDGTDEAFDPYPEGTFVCPESGVYTVLVGAWDAAAPAYCKVIVD